jgi:hypothetical protein
MLIPLVDKATRLAVWHEMADVLFKHYEDAIKNPNSPDGLVAWQIMESLRAHLDLGIDETG